MATQERTVEAAREKATASYTRLMKKFDAMIARQLRKEGDTTVTTPSFSALVRQNIENGMNADAAWSLAGQQSPQAYQAYLREAREKVQAPRVAKADASGTSQVTVTHPQGVKKDRDGVPLSWGEQVKHWKEYPDAYQRYKMHFATAHRRG